MALVLARKSGEGITLKLPDGTAVKIACEIDHLNRVKLSITAPRGVQILRDELLAEEFDGAIPDH